MTGRGADAFDDETLAAREQANSIAALSAVAHAQPRGEAGRFGAVAWIASGLEFRLFNQVQVDQPEADPADVGRAIRVLRERNLRYLVALREGVDDPLIQHLSALGLGATAGRAAIPGMALHPIVDDVATGGIDPPSGFAVHAPHDPTGMADHRLVIAEGFGLPPEAAEQLIGPALLADPMVTIYVGYHEGRPVGSGLGYRTGSTVGIYNISVLPDARRRGFGAAITRRIIADGRAAGCTVATLQSSVMGESVYRAIGFRAVVRYREYIDRS